MLCFEQKRGMSQKQASYYQRKYIRISSFSRGWRWFNFSIIIFLTGGLASAEYGLGSETTTTPNSVSFFTYFTYFIYKTSITTHCDSLQMGTSQFTKITSCSQWSNWRSLL